MSGLTVTYHNGHTALRDSGFTLEGGTLCGLLGVNGSGKSTLFKSIMGMVRPSTGLIRLNGLQVAVALRENQVTYIPQSEDVDWHFPVLVEEVVMMGHYGNMSWLCRPSREDHLEVDRALARVSLTALRRRQIGELSGGQRKRVFLARAQQARILLLDEPFTGVNSQTESTIIALLRQLHEEGHLVLISTHNLASVPTYYDRVVLINGGVVAAGPLEKTFTADNLSRAFGGSLPLQILTGAPADA
ncbi:metal ABC transporter ATP-binding protein [Sodalis glossinidius]|uniref:metal ABC transporter ATP-binding protein n=1 Tax=Sodalis glossinidius TaxID=63612 RepID=UPI0002EFA6E2|nr:ATP-binding cassette domain-containing protein [Sodalis glossinidius]